MPKKPLMYPSTWERKFLEIFGYLEIKSLVCPRNECRGGELVLPSFYLSKFGAITAGESSKRTVQIVQQELYNINNSMWWRQCRKRLYYIMKTNYKLSTTCGHTRFGSQAWLQTCSITISRLKQECEPTPYLLTLWLFFYVQITDFYMLNYIDLYDQEWSALA